jgi:hypothetical protein
MGYAETWKILEEIIIELRKKGIATSEQIMSDLKSAKTLIELGDTREGHGEISPRLEQYFANIEANLITEAQNTFPSDCIDEWLRRLETSSATSGSSCAVCAGRPQSEVKQESRFVPGVPRDKKWVRVTPITSLPKEKLVQLAKDSGLTVNAESDGHLVVYGRAEDIKAFVKKMTTQAAAEEE